MIRPPRKVHKLRVLSLERGAAALAVTPLPQNDDNTWTRVEELLGFDAVIGPGAPVVARSLDHGFSPEVDAVEVRRGLAPMVPHNVFVEHRPEGVNVLNPPSNPVDVLLRHRLRSIPRWRGGCEARTARSANRRMAPYKEKPFSPGTLTREEMVEILEDIARNGQTAVANAMRRPTCRLLCSEHHRLKTARENAA